MKMTKCDRCGKISTVDPTTKNLEFPVIHITKADDIFQSVSPREIDLCQECRKELDGWLTKKTVTVIREKLRESMKETTEISRIIDETVKKMAEPTIGGKTVKEFMQTQAVKAKAETEEEELKEENERLKKKLDNMASDYAGEMIKSNNLAVKLRALEAECGKSTSIRAVDLLDDLISAYHKGIEDLYHLREEAVRRAAAADGETE